MKYCQTASIINPHFSKGVCVGGNMHVNASDRQQEDGYS